MRTRDLLVAESRPELRQGREVQIEITVADGGTRTFRRGDTAAASSGGGAPSAAFVVASLVSTQGLASGKALVADGALVRPSAGGDGGGCGGAGTGGGC